MRACGTFCMYLKVKDLEFKQLKILLDFLNSWGNDSISTCHMRCISLTISIISQLCFLYEEYHPKALLNPLMQSDSCFMKSLAFIYENFHKGVTIKQLASIAMVSPTLYINTFKKIMKTTPIDFIIQCRINKAKDLLLHSNLSIAEIAVQTGFCDASYLYRVFQRHVNCSPNLYRSSQSALPYNSCNIPQKKV